MLIWYIIGFLFLYTITALFVDRMFDIPNNVNITGPILSVRSQKGISKIHSIADSFGRFWSAWGKFGVISAILTGIAATILFVFSSLVSVLTSQETNIQSPTDVVVIPGVNRFLPLDAAPEILLGILVAMIVHEGGHAIYCRKGDIQIKSTGVIFGSLIPIGAFVEPDEEEQENASPLESLEMFSAGIMNNYALFGVSIFLFLLIVSFAISPISGAGVGFVYNNSVAENADLDKGDVIQFADENKISDRDEFREVIQNQSTENIRTADGETVDISGGAYVYSASSTSNISVGKTIVSIDNEEVETVKGLYKKLQTANRTVELTYADGSSNTVRLGTYVVSDSLPTPALIHSVDNVSVRNRTQLQDAISDTNNSEVQITFWSDGESKSKMVSSISPYSVRDRPSAVDLGIGADYYPKDDFYSSITFGNDIQSTVSSVFSSLFLPVASIIPTVSFGFPGFTGFVQNFYTIGIDAGASRFVFFIASVLFWTSWININLAIFNSIPTFALDGGHILSETVDYLIGDRFGESAARIVTYLIKTIVLLPLILIVLLPLIN